MNQSLAVILEQAGKITVKPIPVPPVLLEGRWNQRGSHSDHDSSGSRVPRPAQGKELPENHGGEKTGHDPQLLQVPDAERILDHQSPHRH